MTKYIEMIKDISCGGNFVIKFQSKEISAHLAKIKGLESINRAMNMEL